MNDLLLVLPETVAVPAVPTVQIKLFGSPQLQVASQAISLPRRQLRALLYRLAVELQPLPREHLCFLLWPDVPETAARRHLTVLLNQLRQALPSPDAVHTHNDLVALDPAHVQADTVAFSAALTATGRRGDLAPLAEAVHLYVGPFLHGFALPASPEFDAWVAQERHQWERRYLDALATLVDGYAARGAYSQAIRAAQRALAADELAEEVHRSLIGLYAANGERAAALRQFERCAVVLERELGVEPLPETRAVYDAVRAGKNPLRQSRVERRLAPVAPQIDAGATGKNPLRQSRAERRVAPVAPQIDAGARLKAARAAPYPSLPAPATPLISRQAELAATIALLTNPTVRLLTLTGPGGSGKTRLALQAAWGAAGHFVDGVVFVALAPLRDPTLVTQAIGQACNLSQPSPSALTEHLRDKQLLLVLDNCEHLLEAGPDIAALLAAAPRLRVLATSRAALNLPGEHTFPVPPLPLPDLGNLPRLEALADVPAVALLLSRTRALNPRFQLNAENTAEIAAICVRLDGLPLAIELAAARLKLLAPRDLLRGLERRLTLLSDGSRDLPERQRTLRATIDWSYRLLDTAEQYLFECVAVFAGGWSIGAAKAVCAAPGTMHPLPSNLNVLDGLAVLADKSLVQYTVAEDGTARFSMLETIREYAAEQLVRRGAWEAASQAHADYYASFVKHYDWNTPGWIADMAREHDNLRAMLRWYLDHAGGVEHVLQIIRTLGRFWYWGDYHTEGRWWLKRILAQSEDIRVPARSDVLQQAAALAAAQGDNAGAIALFDANLQLCQELGLTLQRAKVLSGLGIVRCRQGDFASAVASLEEAVALARQLNDPEFLSAKVIDLGSVLVDQGQDIERAIRLYEEGLSIARAQRLPMVESMGLTSLGIALAMTGNYTRAGEALGEALRLQRELHATMAAAWTLQYLGMLAYLQADYAGARQYFAESLAATSQGGGVDVVPSSLDGLAGVASALGQPIRAARLLGAAEALREATDSVLPPIEQRYYNRIRTSVRAQLSEDALHSAWQAGRRLTLKQAIAEAETFARGEVRADSVRHSY